MIDRHSFSIKTLFSVIVISLLVVFCLQGAISLYTGVCSQLQVIRKQGDYVLQMGSLMLRKQTEQREEGLRAIVGGADACDSCHEVLVAAVLDGDRIGRVLKGWLPSGMALPEELLSEEWHISDLVDVYGRNLLTGVRKIMGKRVFAAIRLNFEELNSLGDHSLIPVISDEFGQIVWQGSAQVSPALSQHLKSRGFIFQKDTRSEGWAMVKSYQGSWVMLRQEPLIYGLTFSMAYPLFPLVLSAMSAIASTSALFLFALLIALLLLALLQKSVLNSVTGIAELANEMSHHLSQIDARDPLSSAETLFSVTGRFSEFKRSFVKETNLLVNHLRNLFEVILHQQEELTAFNEETEAMNQELEQVNNKLRGREGLWERTLEFSRSFARDQDVGAAISSTLKTLLDDVNGFGALISSVEQDRFRLIEWVGYNGEIANFFVEKKGIAAAESVITRTPIWIEDVRAHPTAYPVHPMVRSELLIPLFQAGEEEGVLEIAFDRPMRKDPFLIETLSPVASFLGGLIHGEKLRREVKASYAYLAEKLQFVTGIYHDETEAHIARIGEYCRLLARETGRDAGEQDDIALFARLHDIGKLRIPHGILVKPGALTEEEFEQIKMHPQWGAEIIGESSWLGMARNICMTHHERWDGSGYPLGLKGTDIPWEGRIATIADIYDALRSSRSYKPPLTHEQSMKILLEGDGRVSPEHFDPDVLRAFERVSHEFALIFEMNSDERDTFDCYTSP